MQNENDRLRLPVTLKMSDGMEIDGDLIVNIGGTLERTLNSEAKFILFGDPNGTERMIAKTSLMEVTAHKRNRDGSVARQGGAAAGAQTQTPPAAQAASATPPPPASPAAPTNAHELLGVAPTATDAEIQNAFVERVGAYHPDRFKGVHLPDEVSDYINTMSQRIHAAYKELMKDKAPVLTSHIMPPVARAG